MKRVLSAIVCGAFLCLAAPVFAGPLEVEIMDKLKQSSRFFVQKRGTGQRILLSEEEIKILIPVAKTTYKNLNGVDLTDIQAAVFLGQLSFSIVIREDGILK